MRHYIVTVAVSFFFTTTAAASDPAKARDPLDVPAVVTKLTTTTQLSGIGRAGNRLVAVGIRGLIVTSDDDGETWTQRPVPVSSDLLAVYFPTPDKGWAVGHDGVILHTRDGGKSWDRQFDGRQAADQLSKHFTALAATGNEAAKRLLEETRLNYENGPEQALLDVWFEDDRTGFVCGTFGTLLATNDGGKTWKSWVENVESDQLLHLNAIRGVGHHVYIASERGTVFRLDRERKRFIPSATGYNGSLFSLASNGDTVIAGGLRGSIFRSSDAGKTWDKVDSGLIASVTGATITQNGEFLMVSQNGILLMSEGGGARVRTVRVPRATVLSGVVPAGTNKAVVVGLTGVQQVRLK